MNFETWHEQSTSAVLEVWQTTKEKKLKLIVIKLNAILYLLLLQKTSTAHRKSKFFMLKKEQSTKNYTEEKKEVKHN